MKSFPRIKNNICSVRALEIIGEATKNLPDSLKIKYPEVVWNTAIEDAPSLEPLITKILEVHIRT